MIVELNSVASVVDDETFIVYPKYINGGYDKEGGIILDVCSKNWYKSLDEWDMIVVRELLEIKKTKRKW